MCDDTRLESLKIERPDLADNTYEAKLKFGTAGDTYG